MVAGVATQYDFYNLFNLVSYMDIIGLIYLDLVFIFTVLIFARRHSNNEHKIEQYGNEVYRVDVLNRSIDPPPL